ncbi:hypothetical protein [Halopelagius longus]|uniref:Uncharacterized protein n=1 Tax=Halopelagius longus TaxID=1236180 RepID=A0A1H0ZG03_9EURY|nr:hypothetical protein [Halopelagius longus]RDI70276.1 hypothetical protein DWB78_00225 [Halopelagius longus]SDQ26367.1 hypothetical protein SAMN05216278_1205 [Halopelagius longus]
MTTDDAEDALAAVRDAAAERALLDADDARRYLALAGTVERVREEQSSPGGTLAAALACTLAVTRLSDLPSSTFGAGDESTATRRTEFDATETVTTDADASPPSPASPGPAVPASPWSSAAATQELVADGAVVAVRRFDADTETVAARAELPRADLEARLERDS